MTFLNEDSSDLISPQDKAQISTLIEPLFSKNHRDRCYIGLIFQQGKREMLQINVPASDFSSLLQAKPSTKKEFLNLHKLIG